VTAAGRLAGGTQTAYLLALAFDLLPPAKRATAAGRLVHEIERRGWHLATGFVGTPLLAPVLTRMDRSDVAYKLLLQQSFPSWLFPITQGATTMWERWNSYTKEHGFGNVGMNSFNHYAYGAIGEWLDNTVAGIELDPDEPGYKHVVIRPQPPTASAEPALTWARGELMTRYGRVSCCWTIGEGTLTVEAIIPANTRATVVLPGRKPQEVGAGTWSYRIPYGNRSGRRPGRVAT